jgi:hypothetical protein
MKTVQINECDLAQNYIDSLSSDEAETLLRSFLVKGNDETFKNTIETLGDLFNFYPTDYFPTSLIESKLSDLLKLYDPCNSKAYEYISEDDFTEDELVDILVEFV